VIEDQQIKIYAQNLRIKILPYLVNRLAYFCLKIGHFWPLFVSDLVVDIRKPVPVVLPRKSEASGKGFIS